MANTTPEEQDKPVIRVDYNPEHQQMTLDETGQPILYYRRSDGWVLTYEESWCDDYGAERVPLAEAGSNPGEYITFIRELTAVDEAVTSAQGHLMSHGYREIRA